MKPQRKIHRFDPLLRCTNRRFGTEVERFADEIEQIDASAAHRIRGRKLESRDKFRLAIRALLANLALAHRASRDTVTSIPLSNEALRGNPRYRPAVYGKHFSDLIKIMIELKFIEFVTKGYNVRDWARKEVTTIRPRPKLIRTVLRFVSVSPSDFRQEPPPEVVVLKGRDGKLVDYKETKDTRRWRQEITTINNALRGASITTTNSQPALEEDGYIIETQTRALRRIWNDSDWNKGGRLYGGFWQTMKRETRLPTLMLDGSTLANVDFRQFNLRLAYVLANKRPPSGDLYDLTGTDAEELGWKQLREGRKRLTNAMFNARSPLTAWPGRTPDERSELARRFRTTAREAIAQIRSRHAAIAQYFERGAGLNFMRIESDILVATLLSLLKRNVVGLGVHDAVLVPAKDAEIAKKTLERECKRRIGKTIPAEISKADGTADDLTCPLMLRGLPEART